MAGRTPVPERESLRSFAAHHATMVLFLSTGLLESAAAELMAGGFEPDTPAAIVCRASWPDEKTFLCTVRTMAACAWENQITKTALIIVGDAVKQSDYQRSELYHPDFSTGYRQARR
jgi:precorrin-4/cobalt-precorrin-4 C11-methyltransferase